MNSSHIPTYAALTALILVLATSVWFVHAGMHEGTLLGVLITGAVGIAQSIAGIKPAPPPPPVVSITPPPTSPNGVQSSQETQN